MRNLILMVSIILNVMFFSAIVGTQESRVDIANTVGSILGDDSEIYFKFLEISKIDTSINVDTTTSFSDVVMDDVIEEDEVYDVITDEYEYDYDSEMNDSIQ